MSPNVGFTFPFSICALFLCERGRVFPASASRGCDVSSFTFLSSVDQGVSHTLNFSARIFTVFEIYRPKIVRVERVFAG